jgi:indolepyruvate ferredoxin oxidoreductase alpha subunit
MTGFQPTPGSGKTAMGKNAVRVKIEDIARASGVKHVEVVDAYDLEASEVAFSNMLKAEGVTMVIARRLCTTEALRAMRPDRPNPNKINQDNCTGCRICLSQFGCPALIWDNNVGKASIDPTICSGCGVCSHVCPQGAMELKRIQR